MPGIRGAFAQSQKPASGPDMKFLVDAHLPPGLCGLLQAAGHDAAPYAPATCGKPHHRPRHQPALRERKAGGYLQGYGFLLFAPAAQAAVQPNFRSSMNHETHEPHEIKLEECAPASGNRFTCRVNRLPGKILFLFVSFRVFRGCNCAFQDGGSGHNSTLRRARRAFTFLYSLACQKVGGRLNFP